MAPTKSNRPSAKLRKRVKIASWMGRNIPKTEEGKGKLDCFSGFKVSMPKENSSHQKDRNMVATPSSSSTDHESASMHFVFSFPSSVPHASASATNDMLRGASPHTHAESHSAHHMRPQQPHDTVESTPAARPLKKRRLPTMRTLPWPSSSFLHGIRLLPEHEPSGQACSEETAGMPYHAFSQRGQLPPAVQTGKLPIFHSNESFGPTPVVPLVDGRPAAYATATMQSNRRGTPAYQASATPLSRPPTGAHMHATKKRPIAQRHAVASDTPPMLSQALARGSSTLSGLDSYVPAPRAIRTPTVRLDRRSTNASLRRPSIARGSQEDRPFKLDGSSRVGTAGSVEAGTGGLVVYGPVYGWTGSDDVLNSLWTSGERTIDGASQYAAGRPMPHSRHPSVSTSEGSHHRDHGRTQDVPQPIALPGVAGTIPVPGLETGVRTGPLDIDTILYEDCDGLVAGADDDTVVRYIYYIVRREEMKIMLAHMNSQIAHMR